MRLLKEMQFICVPGFFGSRLTKMGGVMCIRWAQTAGIISISFHDVRRALPEKLKQTPPCLAVLGLLRTGILEADVFTAIPASSYQREA